MVEYPLLLVANKALLCLPTKIWRFIYSRSCHYHLCTQSINSLSGIIVKVNDRLNYMKCTEFLAKKYISCPATVFLSSGILISTIDKMLTRGRQNNILMAESANTPVEKTSVFHFCHSNFAGFFIPKQLFVLIPSEYLAFGWVCSPHTHTTHNIDFRSSSHLSSYVLK